MIKTSTPATVPVPRTDYKNWECCWIELATSSAVVIFLVSCPFRTFSVATNLVTAPESFSDCCATMLWRFGQLMSSSVNTHFNSDNSAATSSSTKEYETVPERPGRNEEQSNVNEERTKNSLSSDQIIIQKNGSNITWTFWAWGHEIFCIIILQTNEFCFFFIHEKFLDVFVYRNKFCVSAGIISLMCFSDALGPYIFRRKMGKRPAMR